MNTVALIGFIVLMSTLPYVLAGSRRREYLLWDASSYAFLAALWPAIQLLQIRIDPSLQFALLVVWKLAIFSVFLIVRRPAHGWSAGRAGLFALILYLVLVPHVLQWPIDGDEPYYLLVAESLARDQDLDLRNQYAAIGDSAAGRIDLQPQTGDPVGSRGEQYSRTEPFLSIVLLPGFLLLGLPGAAATIAVFGGLLVRSTLRLLEEEGASDRALWITFVFLALGPPLIWYSTRIWAEVPGAFLLIEVIRAWRSRKTPRFMAAILCLGLLKLRFVVLVVTAIVLFFLRGARGRRTIVIAAIALAVPFLVLFLFTGQWLNVHELWELTPQSWWKYPRGFFGLLLDAQAGLLFQAPFFFLALLSLFRWKEVPPAGRWGLAVALPYLLLLLPREEWHGGWSPPLRYLVVVMPVFCVAAARYLDRISAPVLSLLGIVTAAVTVHGLAFPWRLFHIASGESVFGEFISSRFLSDFSRLFPSFIRPNRAAWIASILLILVVAVSLLFRRIGWRFSVAAPSVIALSAVLLAFGFRVGLQPGRLVHFEDAHVVHRGGALYPPQWTVSRFAHTGGWRLAPGDEVEFRLDGGPDLLLGYWAPGPSTIVVDGRPVSVSRTEGFGSIRVTAADAASHTIRLQSGEVILDRIQHP